MPAKREATKQQGRRGDVEKFPRRIQVWMASTGFRLLKEMAAARNQVGLGAIKLLKEMGWREEPQEARANVLGAMSDEDLQRMVLGLLGVAENTKDETDYGADPN